MKWLPQRRQVPQRREPRLYGKLRRREDDCVWCRLASARVASSVKVWGVDGIKCERVCEGSPSRALVLLKELLFVIAAQFSAGIEVAVI